MASDFGRVWRALNSDAPGRDRHLDLSPGTVKIVDQQIPIAPARHADEVAKSSTCCATETSYT